MISHQDARRNLSPGELIYANSMVAEEIALENKKKKSEAGKNYGKGMTNSSTPIGVNLSDSNKNKTDKTESDRKDSWTDSQTAKKAGVGIGTVARYNRVMNSDDEAKQRKVAVEYVKLCGYKNGEIGNGRKKDSHNGKATQLTFDQIADQLGTSKTNLKRALSIERNLTESMKQLLDDGVISKTDQQRKSGNVSRNWKDCMGLEMVQQMKKAITELVSRIIRLTKNLNPT